MDLIFSNLKTMKKYLFLLLFFCTLSFSYAQSNLYISYDEAGNRISRGVVLISSAYTSGDSRLAGTLQEPIPDDFISVYPNPTSYYVNIEFAEMEDTDNISYQLFDEQGRFVTKGQIQSTPTQLDISKESNGNYFLYINHNGRKGQWQIIKIG